MDDFAGKVAVVTGAAGGIGSALARRFVGEGAAVVLADVDDDALARTAAVVRAQGGKVEAVATDITKAQAVEALADAAYKRFGHVDVLCANVGIMGPELAPIWTLPLRDWQNVLAVNTFGTVHTIGAFVPRMVADNRDGHIVVTASMAGLTASSITTAPYLASKHAARSIAETLRRDLASIESPLGVSVLCPGPVNTGMLAHVRAAFPSFDTAHAAVGGEFVLEPDEVAGIVVDAIRSRRFYIFTHADSRRRVTDWFDSILEDLPA
jgi:NAD(P)-dependent dehydrogenase (short-subunit alcohol dehydrogenase family)